MNCDTNKGSGRISGTLQNTKGNRLIQAIPLLVLGIFLANCQQSKGNEDIAALIGALNNNTSANATDPGEAYSGGYTTNFITNVSAFDVRAANLRYGGASEFNSGNAFFNRNWAAEGSSAAFGLGPTFNTNSCQNCHLHDGRGAPPSSGSADNSPGILFRLSKDGTDPTTGGPVGLTNYGLQLNHKAIGCNPILYTGVNFDCDTGSGSVAGANFTPPEGTVSISYATIAAPNYPSGSHTYPDGTDITLSQPTYTFTWNALFGDPTSTGEGFHFSPRTAQIIPGLGLLEAIPDSILQGWADPSDLDGDGISGKINQVWDITANAKKIGRFGWKSNEPTLFQQTQGAFQGDIGITSPLHPVDNCPAAQTACLAAASGSPDPEITASLANAVIFYNKLVGVPARRNINDPDVIAGKALFSSVGCDSCHKTLVQTGYVSGFPELSYQYIKPYTDLLLHDMGPGLADGRQDFDATGQEWRTAPLWGIGLMQTVNGHTKLLHDGRANGIEEAILWHGGEAQTARQNFQVLTATQRAQLIQFLKSL
ncbi:thiol oxidoreductase [Leptospira langatensis]|uniref:Thiol oxidoreductase n=1 Tax=Leptospira langatensis TaxID=2484983 RepID=A0A5F1ZT87_9LEPT|nr:di-heme oxidoredictase family protein [Leptospira langatensis]TGK02740.1 thiol oxidoreductase [Leptospira langatensis]TGL40056.1 thiol oxidoreductase [Leptospira langatensis]